MLDVMVANVEIFYQSLGLPYRLVVGGTQPGRLAEMRIGSMVSFPRRLQDIYFVLEPS